MFVSLPSLRHLSKNVSYYNLKWEKNPVQTFSGNVGKAKLPAEIWDLSSFPY